MLTVIFEGLGVTVRARAGDALIDLCDESAAPVPFSCRDASCGTCLVEILEGAGALDPIGLSERRLLAVMGVPLEHRLACRARVAGNDGLIRLRVAAPPLKT